MEKKINKENLKKFASISILGTALVASGIAIEHASINHLIEYCPLNNILGVEHQLNAIKNIELYNTSEKNGETIYHTNDFRIYKYDAKLVDALVAKEIDHYIENDAIIVLYDVYACNEHKNKNGRVKESDLIHVGSEVFKTIELPIEYEKKTR